VAGWRLGGVLALGTALCGLVAGGLVGSDVPVAGPVPVPLPVESRTTVTVYGAAGTFGSLGDTLPSGQRLTRTAVPGWGLPAARLVSATAVAADGTVFAAVAGGSMVSVYQPGTHRYTSIPVPGVGDLQPVAGGTAVAFAAWPVIGVLSRVDGRWRAAPTGEWSAARPSAVGGPAGPDATTMAYLPASHDIVVAHSVASPAGYDSGLTVLRVAGPDAPAGTRSPSAASTGFRTPA
jgi:hypothetical protein